VDDSELRKHVLQLLAGGQAHPTFKDTVDGFPVDKAEIRPGGSPHSGWELLEHIRISLDDIVRFSGVMDDRPRAAGSRELPEGYVVLDWPGDYWPKSPGMRDAVQWKESVAAVEESMTEFTRLIKDPKRDLFEPFPWGDGQTLLREALLIADHGAYHIGQLLLVRRMLEAR
jgi:hypothetical protein